MMILDGKALSTTIKQEIRTDVNEMIGKGERPPHLAAVLVGNNPASEAYVGNKVRSCEEVGFSSTLIRRPESISEQELLDIVRDLNEDDEVDGFIVQLPLPPHINEEKVTLAIDPRKDVDGFHPLNFGRMAQGLPAYLPATPQGVLLLLERNGIETSGQHVVIVGRSNIVGTPLGILLSRKDKVGNATVTMTHSRTRDLAAETRRADILVAAIGIPRFITGDMVKDGVVVIDVGINRIDDATRKSGSRLVGDVDYDEVAPKSKAITPVPGGVGPMTVTALMLNTLKARRREIHHGQ
ncbi:MAG: bifunctional methylenetetrahydrofolate dehydrogenase/methenyltetrahydrofolate cyclohydrolase FolD [Saprospiraceae bacterium]|nr:bifunctional methylenetetrahydrofolate dehydrogenase/methenyltetrahydrofolate cyclohydrolase FolD [Saprospiraceae bacterium]MCB9311592.1 bifunctional methylenetetrahydrofolate dehydrogenase/methenyltetrahydrofolate cyclohydrolase FolD [Lewinellaceae bacterium]